MSFTISIIVLLIVVILDRLRRANINNKYYQIFDNIILAILVIYYLAMGIFTMINI